MIKNLTPMIVLALLLSVAGMTGIYWLGNQEVQRGVSRIQMLSERQSIADSMTVSLEQYRRRSGGFRLLPQNELNEVKAKLRADIVDGVKRLEKLEATSEEKALGAKVSDSMSEFLGMSAKLEPMLFTKDVYQKEQMRDIHDTMLKSLATIRNSAIQRRTEIPAQMVATSHGWLRYLAIAGVAVIFMTGLLIIFNHLRYARPLKKLVRRVREVSAGKLARETTKGLRREHAEIERTLIDVAFALDQQRRERQQFVTAVASDLRAPLVSLQASANLLAAGGERLTGDEKRFASNTVNRSVFRLSRSLDDLTDIVETDRKFLRLDEKITDIREVANEVARVLGGPGALHQVTATVPANALWTMIDPMRVERALTNLVSKMMLQMPQGGRIEIAIERPQGRGIEITVQDADRSESARARSSGPEQDLLRHWVSENGYGMALVHKIVQSHGGTITASGVAGTSVVFTMRLPADRVAGDSSSQSAAPAASRPATQHAAPSAFSASDVASVFDSSWIKPMASSSYGS